MRLSPVWVLCLLAAACTRDPIDTPGTWHAPPAGFTSNDDNLRAMVVRPRDLVVGRGERTSVAVTGAAAARRQLSGRRSPLPNANVSISTGLSGSQAQPQQNPGAGGAGGRSE